MRIRQLTEWGRIVKGVNTTVDVGPDEITKQAKKFGNTVDKDGRPPTLSKKVKGSKTNVLFNLGLAEKYLKEATELSSASTIYVDMDGVLADFFGDWAKLMGVDKWYNINKKHDIGDALQKIRETDDFWLNLPMTNNARNLLNLIKQVKGSYKILSSPLPDDPNSEPHKREWVEKNLSFFEPDEVIITHDKAKYATQQDGTPNILIDDYGVNIQKWESAGGVGFKHKDHKFERTAKNIKQHMQEPVKEESVEEKIKFVEPNFNSEWDEAARYPEFQKIGKEAWIELAKKGKAFTVESVKDINNTDAADPDSFKSLDPAKQKRALAQLEKNEVEMPIVAVYSDGYKELVGGNTRLTAMMARDSKATVWAFYVPDEVAELEDLNETYTREQLPQLRQKNLKNIRHTMEWVHVKDIIPVQKERIIENFKRQVDRILAGKYNPIIVDCDNKIVNGHHRYEAAKLLGYDEMVVAKLPITVKQIVENFADGKTDSKSRPGRVKRSGASCNGSVTDLRKRAKNASGEKARMYHWCANMKSGRKKG